MQLVLDEIIILSRHKIRFNHPEIRDSDSPECCSFAVIEANDLNKLIDAEGNVTGGFVGQCRLLKYLRHVKRAC